MTDDNGLYYMRSRYYNPEIKRFINQDILTGNIGNNKSLNRYSYVQGNPVSYTDPFGLSPFSYLSEPIHSVLSMAGVIPVIGVGFDIMNSAIYLMEGEKNKAVLNLVCLIPGEKAVKYAIKNGKKIAAVSAATAIFCQTDAGAGLKADLIELKDDAVEFYGLDNLNAMDYLIIAVAGANVINGGRASRLDIDLPNKRIPDAELAGTGVRLDIDSFDDAISNKNNAWNNFWNDNRGCVDLDGFSNKGGIPTVDDFIKQKVNPNFQQNVREAFMNDIKVTVLEQDMTVYRYHGGGSNGVSYWYTPNQTSNPAADLALPQGNTYQYMDTYVIPKGTTILEGTVAPNFGQPGGGYQYYVPDPSVVIGQ